MRDLDDCTSTGHYYYRIRMIAYKSFVGYYCVIIIEEYFGFGFVGLIC